ncbi:hypothetical protein ACFQUU_17590 [Herbaspirillum sp. GCM10030257]
MMNPRLSESQIIAILKQAVQERHCLSDESCKQCDEMPKHYLPLKT